MLSILILRDGMYVGFRMLGVSLDDSRLKEATPFSQNLSSLEDLSPQTIPNSVTSSPLRLH